MLIPNYPNFEYPNGSYINGDVLYNSMGSFWSQLFNGKAVVQGLAWAQANELEQRYLDLVESLNGLSVKDVPIYHREKWTCIRIRQSDFKLSPLKVRAATDTNVAYFGAQPADSTDNGLFHAGETFIVGEPKSPTEYVYEAPLPVTNVKQLYVLCNRIINPSVIWVEGVDFKLDGFGNILFNKDIFAQGFTTVDLIEEADQELWLWAYNTQSDTELLYQKFGYIFNFKLEDQDAYKDVLQKTVALFTNGPTVQALTSIACAFVGIPSIIEAEEVIQKIYTVDAHTVIATDKNVYKYPVAYTLTIEARVGNKVYAGAILVDVVEYYDNLTYKNWWQTKLLPNEAVRVGLTDIEYSFPKYFFLGNYEGALTFRNKATETAYLENGDIVFPVYGNVLDVATFHNNINSAANKATVKTALGLSDTVTSVTLNPLSFLFDNFLKSNTALIKFNFASLDDSRLFISYFNIIKGCLPAHVYFIFNFDFEFPIETLPDLNGGSDLWVYDRPPIQLSGTAIKYETIDGKPYYTYINAVAHGLVDGDKVRFISSDTLPSGASSKRVYTIAKIDDDNFHLTDDRGTEIWKTAGTGTMYIVKVANTWTRTVTLTSVDHADGSDTDGYIPVNPANALLNRTPDRLFYFSKGLDLYTADADEILTNINFNGSDIPAEVVNGAFIVEGHENCNLVMGYTYPGTITTATLTATTHTVTGINTEFLKYVRAGDFIVNPQANEKVKVLSVTDDTHLITEPFLSPILTAKAFTLSKTVTSNSRKPFITFTDYNYLRPLIFSEWLFGATGAVNDNLTEDTTNWAYKVYLNGGTYTTEQLTAVNTFSQGLNDLGITDDLLRVGILCGSDLTAATVPFISTVGYPLEDNHNFTEDDYSPTVGLTPRNGAGIPLNTYLDTGVTPRDLANCPDGVFVSYWTSSAGTPAESIRADKTQDIVYPFVRQETLTTPSSLSGHYNSYELLANTNPVLYSSRHYAEYIASTDVVSTSRHTIDKYSLFPQLETDTAPIRIFGYNSLGTGINSNSYYTRPIALYIIGKALSTEAKIKGLMQLCSELLVNLERKSNPDITISFDRQGLYGLSNNITAIMSPATLTGTVEFFDNNVSLGTATLTDGVATLATEDLGLGLRSIKATHSGGTTNTVNYEVVYPAYTG